MDTLPHDFFPPPQSLLYYNDLRKRYDIPYEKREDSPIVKLQDKSGPLRLLHLDSFMPLTEPTTTSVDNNNHNATDRTPSIDSYIYWEAAGLLAMLHFNERDGSIVPDLPARLQDCDLRLTMTLHDTQNSPIQSAKQLYPLLFNRIHSLQTPIPGGLIGSVQSAVTRNIAGLAGLSETPVISPAVSSSVFDSESENSPTLVRTIPPNPAYARAVVKLLKHWGVSHAAFVYPLGDFGASFLEEMIQVTAEYGIVLTVSGYRDQGGVSAALQQVRDLRYIVAVVAQNRVEQLLLPALDLGMVSEEYVWMIPQRSNVADPTFTLPRSEERFARALHGAAFIDINIQPKLSFTHQMFAFKSDRRFRSFYVDSHAESFIFDNYDFQASSPILSTTAYTNYDAVMAMGIAACEQQSEFFTRKELFDQLVATEFDGISGRVSFDPKTRTRSFGGVQYGFTNVLIDDDTSTHRTIRFKSRLSLVIDTANATSLQEEIHQIQPFVFHSGSTEKPSTLPALEVNNYLIPLGTRCLGWALGGAAMLLALCLGIWTYNHRKDKVLRLTQPLFLGMMCFGTFLMASAVLFRGWQEPWSHLNVACIVSPWLLVLGFSTAFSALFAKTWRINRLFNSAANMSRTQIQAKDVLWPFLLVTAINVFILSVATIFSPPHWIRVTDPQVADQFGRSTHSCGRCSGGHTFWWGLGGFNFIMVLFANYQSYVGRNMPSEFNESYYVALAMASLMECFLIGAPIFGIVAGNPSAEFILEAVLIAFSCFSILLPMFFHKIKARSKSSVNVARSFSVAFSAVERQSTTAATRRRSLLRSPSQTSMSSDEILHENLDLLRFNFGRRGSSLVRAQGNGSV